MNNIIESIMPKSDFFFDSSALIAGIVSAQGAARALLLLAEDEKILITVSEQVIVEVERNIARKAPKALPFARQLILAHKFTYCTGSSARTGANAPWIGSPTRRMYPSWWQPVQARVDFLVTLNTRHFLEDPGVAQRSGLLIGTPGDALAWVRNQLAGKQNSS